MPWLAIAALFLLTPAVPSAGEKDYIFANGFELLAWHPDADGDDYGDSAIVVYDWQPPPGHVADGSDCNDADASIHPGAADDPDAAVIDSNCDGIDGDLARAVFVAASGIDSGSCATPASACATPAYALTQISAQRSQVYLQVGNYAGPLLIGVDAALFGGYDADWQRTPLGVSGPVVTLLGGRYLGAVSPIQGQFVSVFIGPAQQVRLADIEVVGPEANAQSAEGHGLSSYAIFVEPGTQLTMDRCRVLQGNGADGASGTVGLDAPSLAAAPGGSSGGDAASVFTCNSTSRGSPGAAVNNACSSVPSTRTTRSGAGGAGGTADSSCPFDLNARPGIAGQPADFVQGNAGQNGIAGLVCMPGGDGRPGLTVDGSGGAGVESNRIVDGLWISAAGLAGGTGENGSGGGGGGGSGGCDTGTDAYGAGGGSGGAGGCAARSGGSGGHGGGSSFGVYLRSAQAVIHQTTFLRGNGGRGGDGGAGGMPQPGGSSGPGGLGANAVQRGGHGGAGARGGAGGGGGGGRGGSVYGVYAEGPLDVAGSGNQFLGGTPGLPGFGGPGGFPGVANGQAGFDGALGTIGVCVTGNNCN